MEEAREWNKKVGHPMQSWEWGEFRERMGNKVTRVGRFQIIWSRLPFGFWFGYCPMSPLPTDSDLKKIKDLGGIGVRFEPNVKKNGYMVTWLHGLIPGRHLFKPKTYWIDLRLPEDELLKIMTSKCRYNIRLAQKHGVRIAEGDAESYWELMKKTMTRQKIYAHSEKYHRELAKLDFVRLFKAEYQEKTIASWLIFCWKGFIYYAYGAFDDEYKNLMAPVLGLWEIIKWGKANGYKTLDLWGAEEGKGFSRFKEQFGPKLVEMVGTYDLPTSWLYGPFRLAEEIRWVWIKSRRGF